MWGNRLGWMISAGIMVVTVGVYAMLLLGPAVSTPTDLTTHAGAMNALTLPASAKPLITDGGGDGTALYAEALDAYRGDRSAFDAYAAGGPSAKINSADFKKVLPAMDLLAQAAGSAKSAIFATHPDSVVKYNPDQADALKPVEQLGRIAIHIGIQYNIAKKPDLAKKYLNAGFALGYAMCNERLVYHELRIGQDLMRTAALNLATIDTANGPAFKGIDAQYREFYEAQQKFMALCNPSDDKMIATHAGDVFNLAENSQERMWRVEAVMMLGHLRYNASQPGDQRGADAALAKLAGDNTLDPAVAAAVKAAQNLTIEQHRNSQQM